VLFPPPELPAKNMELSIPISLTRVFYIYQKIKKKNEIGKKNIIHINISFFFLTMLLLLYVNLLFYCSIVLL